MSPLLIVIVVFATGFAAGFGVRAYISHRRRLRAQHAAAWAGMPHA